jgi:hypothetical protein
MDDRTPPSATAVEEREPNPHPTRAPARPRHRHARRHHRPRHGIMYAAGGLFGAGGTGWWLFEKQRGDLSVTGLHIPASVALWGLAGLAGWGALLLLGELTLFVLAIVNVSDPEVHDRCRNLMILWGYVLTLGTSRLFRRLPAQFAQLFADENPSPTPDHDRPRPPQDR